jgi:hypothetical protein
MNHRKWNFHSWISCNTCRPVWLNFHSSWTPSHYEIRSVIFVKMPIKSWTKTACLKYMKTYPCRIFSLIYSIQEISLFLTFRFCRDGEFRAIKIQAQCCYKASIRPIAYRICLIIQKVLLMYNLGSYFCATLLSYPIWQALATASRCPRGRMVSSTALAATTATITRTLSKEGSTLCYEPQKYRKRVPVLCLIVQENWRSYFWIPAHQIPNFISFIQNCWSRKNHFF